MLEILVNVKPGIDVPYLNMKTCRVNSQTHLKVNQ